MDPIKMDREWTISKNIISHMVYMIWIGKFVFPTEFCLDMNHIKNGTYQKETISKIDQMKWIVLYGLLYRLYMIMIHFIHNLFLTCSIFDKIHFWYGPYLIWLIFELIHFWCGPFLHWSTNDMIHFWIGIVLI